MFSPVGKNNFTGHLEEMNKSICDAIGVAIFDFPDEGTMEDYLTTTYFYLQAQPWHLMGDKFEDNDHFEATNTENMLLTERSSVTVSVEASTTTSDGREVSFEKGQSSLRCEQNHEYEESPLANSIATARPEAFQPENVHENDQLTSIMSPHEIRDLRLAHFQPGTTCYQPVQVPPGSQDNYDHRLVLPSEDEVSPTSVEGSYAVLEEGGK